MMHHKHTTGFEVHHIEAQEHQKHNSCVTSKGKAIPLQAWTGPEGSGRLRLQISKQSGHEGGKVVSPTHQPPLPPGNIPGTQFC